MLKIKILKSNIRFKTSLFIALAYFGAVKTIFPQQINYASASSPANAQSDFQSPMPRIYCEEALIRMADVVDKASNEGEAHLIIILHLANVEQPRLFEKRRKVLDTYLKNHFSGENQKYVIAQGSRVKTQSRADFYVGGKLFERFAITRNNPSVCVEK